MVDAKTELADSAKNKRLVSVIIVAYRNFNVLFRALKTVLEQDYERLEIIISDDGSEYFNTKSVKEYIEENKQGNLENVVVLRNLQNVGTVKNLNRAFAHFKGDYYITLGADDSLASPSVISDFVSVFEEYNNEPYIVCGHLAMRSQDMKTFLKRFNSKAEEELIKRRNPDELFRILSYNCILATVATCYRREFLEIIGGYDESYVYLEDWPAFLKMVKKGIVPVLMNSYAANHAAGGIANGNGSYSVDKLKQFFKDKALMWEREVEPYLDRLSQKDRALYKARRKQEKKRYILECEYQPSSYNDKIKMMLSNPRIFLWIMNIKRQRAAQRFKMATSDWMRILMVGMISLLTYCAFKYVEPIDGILNNVICLFSLSMGFILVISILLRAFISVQEGCSKVVKKLMS